VFNLAWEDVAENVAAALRAEKLLMFTDKLPLDRRGQVMSELTAREAEALVRKGDLTAQTSRTLEHAVRALGAGVGRAHLLSRREERGIRLPRGSARVSRRGLRRAAAACLPGARQGVEAAQALRADDACRALVSRAGLSSRGRRGAALAAPGALQLAARFEGLFEAHIIRRCLGW